MSIASASKRSGSTILRIFVLAVVALCVVCLQIALPLVSYSSAGQRLDPDRHYALNDAAHGNGFWDQRLRFDAFLDLEVYHETGPWFSSAVVFNNELFILVSDRFARSDERKSRDLVRVDLRTGKFTTSAAPNNVIHILSDGETIRWLPEVPVDDEDDDGAKYPFVSAEYPFLMSGRPVTFVTDDRTPEIHRLIEFVDGHWRNTDEYALISADHTDGFAVHHQGGEIFLLKLEHIEGNDGRDFYYRRGVEFGTEQQAKQHAHDCETVFDQAWEGQFRKSGWSHRHFRKDDETPRLARYGCQVGSWGPIRSFTFANRIDDGLFYDMTTWDSGKRYDQSQIRYRCFPPDRNVQVRSIPSPIPWGPNSTALAFGSAWMRAIPQSDGVQWIVSYDLYDGRMHVLRWENGELFLVAQRRSPFLTWFCIDGASLFGVIVAIPMLLLGLAMWYLQSRRRPASVSFGHQTRTLAAVVRRGFARLIDIGLPGGLLLVSLILNPDVTGWWMPTICRARGMFYRIKSFVFAPGWGSLSEVHRHFRELFTDVVSTPIPWIIYIAVIAIVISQIVWQARTGRTLGKWLLGIKAVRTTLRPCGFARSLLRELLLVVDTLMLLSWVPGAICLLATRNSQRVGDILADTVVVRDSKLILHPISED